MKKIIHFFDKLEDKVRAKLSHYPIMYSLIAGFAIVLFWRAVWALADQMELSIFWSFVISLFTLLVTGLFSSFFVGDAILMSGLKREKKIMEKTEDELNLEAGVLKQMQSDVSREESLLSEIKSELTELRGIIAKLEKDTNK